MARPDVYLSEPATHPRLGDPAATGELAAAWRAQRWVRVPDVLEPGLAAELAHVLSPVVSASVLDETRAEVAWRTDVRLPDGVDPQHPQCLYRLARFLRRDLPALARAITGWPVATEHAGVIQVCAYRKGSFADVAPVPVPPRRIPFRVGLTGGTWPEAWGGHAEILDGDEIIARLPPAWDTLDLVDRKLRVRVPVLRRAVEALCVRGTLARDD